MAGIGYYQFIEKLEKDFEQRKEETVEELCKLMKKILRPENFMISYTGERESMETGSETGGSCKGRTWHRTSGEIGREADLHKEK